MLKKWVKAAIIFGAFLGLIIVLSLQPVYSAQVETVAVPPGTTQSIVFNLDNGDKVTGSLSVAGGAGNDVNFIVKDPAGNPIIPERRVAEGWNFDFTATSNGAYTLYFDNSFSIVSSKQVSLSYDIAKPIVPGSRCLIATAAFGSELSPQVQLLREFRDDHVLLTRDGSSFMAVFNAWYYSFSPYVADYERSQPWLQQIVRGAIYPLLGILTISEKVYSIVPGEYGSLSAGFAAASMIGAVYFWPFAISFPKVRKDSAKYNYKLAAIVFAVTLGSTVFSIIAANQTAMMITTSIFILGLIGIFSALSAKILARAMKDMNESAN